MVWDRVNGEKDGVKYWAVLEENFVRDCNISETRVKIHHCNKFTQLLQDLNIIFTESLSHMTEFRLYH